MTEYDPPSLRYRPQREAYIPDLSGPMEAMLRHQADLRAQQQAEAAMALREREQSHRESSDAVSQEQHARGMLMQDRREGQREGLNGRMEERRNREAILDRQKLHDQEHEGLIHAYHMAATGWEKEAAADALRRAGYHVEQHGPGFDQPGPDTIRDGATPSAPDDPTLGGTLLAPGDDAPPAAAPVMSKRDAATASELDAAGAKTLAGLQPGDSNAKYFPGRNPTPGRAAGMARYDYGLADDDPLNKYVK